MQLGDLEGPWTLSPEEMPQFGDWPRKTEGFGGLWRVITWEGNSMLRMFFFNIQVRLWLRNHSDFFFPAAVPCLAVGKIDLCPGLFLAIHLYGEEKFL